MFKRAYSQLDRLEPELHAALPTKQMYEKVRGCCRYSGRVVKHAPFAISDDHQVSNQPDTRTGGTAKGAYDGLNPE